MTDDIDCCFHKLVSQLHVFLEKCFLYQNNNSRFTSGGSELSSHGFLAMFIVQGMHFFP